MASSCEQHTRVYIENHVFPSVGVGARYSQKGTELVSTVFGFGAFCRDAHQNETPRNDRLNINANAMSLSSDN